MFDRRTKKFCSAVIEALPEVPEDIMQGWIANPRGLQKVLRDALVPPPVFQIWKTIKLGTSLKTADDFRRALKQAGCKLGNKWGNDVIDQCAFTASETETDADLVVISVAELGFKNGATRTDIYTRAQELGLSLCPAEVGPQLRLQYTNQPKGEWLLVAMEPIADSVGNLDVFSVEHDDNGLLLYGYGLAYRFWSGNRRWVFLRK